MRITRVYTKTGDAGQTSLVSGDRVSKADLRVSAYGDVDELNSVLGVTRTFSLDAELNELLGRLQNELFTVGADLATPSGTPVPRVDEEMVTGLEEVIDKYLAELEPLKEFILPGGSQAGAMLHLARTVARRAERVVVALAEREEINAAALRYLNRLSDLLFVLARAANKRAGTVEESAQFSQRGRRKKQAE
ncbi:MAG TPA: cob(I)yrinic acid a,c-diamide adenosyltransferase [Blastocatellia bacterium]|nr:cob(I)yrinic acid a,c-diamide adenosyltransferase [Blastocatellia bacterium]